MSRHSLVLAFLGLMLWACGPTERSWESLALEAAEKPLIDTLYSGETLYTWVNDLRVRSLPFGKGQIVATLQEGDRVLYLGEKTPSTEKMSLRGHTYDLPWVKVSFSQDQEGWVHQAGLRAQEIEDGRRLRRKNLQDATEAELSALLGLDLRPERLYAGFYEYVQQPDGQILLHGRFQFDSQVQDDQPEEHHQFKGYAIMGRKQGPCTWTWTLKQQKGRASLEFNAIEDRCIKGEYKVQSPGLCLAYEGPLPSARFADMAAQVEEVPCPNSAANTPAAKKNKKKR